MGSQSPIFDLPGGDLGFSVGLFTGLAVVCIVTLIARPKERDLDFLTHKFQDTFVLLTAKMTFHNQELHSYEFH